MEKLANTLIQQQIYYKILVHDIKESQKTRMNFTELFSLVGKASFLQAGDVFLALA